MSNGEATIFKYDDGGRAAAGYRGTTGDCVVRAVSIASGRPYQEVYALVNELGASERRSKKRRGKSSARTGVFKPTTRKLMESLGFAWTPTMAIGSGCTTHVRRSELPTTGRHILALSRHVCALVDGVILDTCDPSRGGTRCVYGYWSAP